MLRMLKQGQFPMGCSGSSPNGKWGLQIGSHAAPFDSRQDGTQEALAQS